MKFSIFDSNGTLLRTGYAPDDEVNNQVMAGEILVTGESYPEGVYLDVVTSTVLTIPPAPSIDHVWEHETKTWTVDIAKVRERVLWNLKRERDRRDSGGFVWDGDVFDSDIPRSQSRLLGAFSTAVAGYWPATGENWRLKNNEWRNLSATDVLGVWAAFQAHLSSVFNVFKNKEEEIGAITTVEELQAYDVTTGWG